MLVPMDNNVCQFQTSFRPVNLVQLTIFTISHKMYSSRNLPSVIGILNIISHTRSKLAIQHNYKCLLWNYIWILVQQFMN